MPLKYHKIFNHDHLNSRELSETYMSGPTDRGRLFVLVEIPKIKTDQQHLIDEIISQAATYFDTSHQENPEILLEEILQQLNQILPELAASSKVKNWLATLDVAIGIIYGDEIHLASLGNVLGLLIHNNQITPTIAPSTKINPNKAFSDIISGRLDEGDALIVSTNSLFDYISQEKIKQIIKQYSPSAAAIKINELLESVPEFVTFNSLIIKKPGLGDREIVPSAQNSDEIIEEEKPVKMDSIASERKSSHRTAPRTKLVVDVGAIKKIGAVNKAQKVGSWTGAYFSTVKKVLLYIVHKIKTSWLFVFSSKYRKEKEEKTLDNIKQSTEKKYSWFANLSAKKKIALVILTVILLVFIQSLVFLTQEKAVEQKNEDYNLALAEIKNKYDEVEAKLIYNDEKAAENILLEIQGILDSLDAGSPQQQEQIAQLQTQLFNKLNKVRHIYVVPSPVELFDFSQQAIVQTNSLVQKEGDFYLLADNSLYLLKEEAISQIYDFGAEQTAVTMADWPSEDKLVISLRSGQDTLSYSIFDLSSNQISGTLNKAAENSSVKDIAIYSDNLYVLDTEQNQIFKYPESGSGFAGGQKWLLDQTDLSQVSSLTIDGSIYVISNTGEIKNFLKGRLEEFDYHEPHPEIGPNTIIKTFRDSDYLYILDPQEQRVIILNKDGNIQDQYTSQQFDNLTDLAIDPAEKTIYLLNGTHIYLLAINE